MYANYLYGINCHCVRVNTVNKTARMRRSYSTKMRDNVNPGEPRIMTINRILAVEIIACLIVIHRCTLILDLTRLRLEREKNQSFVAVEGHLSTEGVVTHWAPWARRPLPPLPCDPPPPNSSLLCGRRVRMTTRRFVLDQSGRVFWRWLTWVGPNPAAGV